MEKLLIQSDKDIVFMDYYQQAFYLFHEEIDRKGPRREDLHPIRNRFWQFVEKKEYSATEAAPILNAYLRSITSNIEDIISKQSIAYWLHLSRRIFPETNGLNNEPITRLAIRTYLDTAIQKYGRTDFCNKVGNSKEVGLEKILNGILLNDDFEMSRKAIEELPNQLVLTDFSTIDLEKYYTLEKLIYEVWKTAATIRIVGKGSSIIVNNSNEIFFDNRSDELDFLVTNFDERLKHQDFSTSKKGVVFSNDLTSTNKLGYILVPTYNVNAIVMEDIPIRPSINFKIPFIPNFIWFPINLRDFYNSHNPFSQEFSIKHACKLEAVLFIIAALGFRLLHIWYETQGLDMLNYFQRAYEGPYLRDYIFSEIQNFKRDGCFILGIDENSIDNSDIVSGFNFLELNKQKQRLIDLHYPGPHSIFLPAGENRYFIDYCNLRSILPDLFFGVNLDNEKFKGRLLESLIQPKEIILPTNPCKAKNGEKRQIDCAFAIDNRLIIVECKAINMSIGVEKGQPAAINFRSRKKIDALNEIDEKAEWLINNQVGNNYDISGFDEILPIVVSPFVEYIPERIEFFWINSNIPRVLTPKEILTYKENGVLKNAIYNLHKK